MVKRDCKFCAFYKSEDAAKGLCMFDPPRVFQPAPETSFSARPVTHPGDLCHNFEISDDVDPEADLNVDFGSGERVRLEDGREGTVIADGEKIGTYRVAIDGAGLEEISGSKLEGLAEE